MTKKLVRFGYLELEGGALLQPGKRIKGHEFHYYDSTNNGDYCVARKPGRNKSWPCIAIGEKGNLFAGFPHLYYYSEPGFIRSFLERCAGS